jgi:CysZ protein
MLKVSFNNIKQTVLQYEIIAIDTLGIYFNAHQFIKKHNLKRYFLVTGIAFLLLFTITIKALLFGVDYIQEPISQKLLPLLQKFVNLNTDNLLKGISALFWLIKTTIESNQDAIFSGIFLIIGTPFFSFISSKTEELATGKNYPFKWSSFFKEIKRGLSLSFRNSLKQLGLILIITLLDFVPIINISTPLLTFLVQAYYNGILMTDYTLERQGFTIKESQLFYKVHKPEMFGIGLGFMFLLLIPVVGWFIAPTYAIVASYLQFSKLNH